MSAFRHRDIATGDAIGKQTEMLGSWPASAISASRAGRIRRGWPGWYEHMGSMIGGGIAFHTAFLVLGAGRLSGLQLTGMAAIVSWILPSIIGIPASAIWTGYYKRRFRESGPGSVTPVARHQAGA